jgi:hypothetical protein
MNVPWRLATASVRGAAHAHAGRPNQDALCQLPLSGDGWPFIAVADGHGSAKSFRSETGAILAVASAMVVVPQILSDPAAVGVDSLKLRLPQRVVDVWRLGVERHIAENPFTQDEWARLLAVAGPQGRTEVEANPWLAYGATLLFAAARAEHIVYAQLGDGDILLVAADGIVSRPCWPADRRLFANETTSLCRPEAWRDMRVDVQSDSPALIMLATDGYANSFASDADFRRVGTDLLGMIRADGLDAVAAALPDWLDESSRLGSGDDITLGLIYNIGVTINTPSAVVAKPLVEAIA